MSDANAQARARAEAVLEAARRTLALPRVQGDPWPLPERDEPPRAAAPDARPSRPAPRTGKPERLAAAIAEEVGARFVAERRSTALRFVEAERRLAELEAAVERLEGRAREAGGQGDG